MLESFKGSYLKLIFIILLPFVFIACGGSSSSGGGGSSKFEVSVVDGYISKATVEDNASDEADENSNNLGHYTFSKTPTGELNASGGVFSESNITNRMVLKAPALSKVISPITTLLVDFPDLNSTLLQNALNVTEEQLVGNFLSADDLNIAKLAQIVYGMYVNDLLSEFKSSLNGSSPASLDDIFDIGKDVVNASSIIRKTDLLAFFDALENYNGTTSALEVAIKDQKQKAQSDSPFEVSVIDGYISDARVSDIDGKLAEHNESKIGYYNFRVSPYGELNASGGIFSESNITNHMVLKAPPLSRVISPITTLLLDFSNLATILESALGVTNEQLVGNFLSADDLNIAKLAQITYGMYVTDNADDFNASLSANPPASLDDIFDIAEDIANSKGDAGLVAFLGAVESYSGTTKDLERAIKEQKDAIASAVKFSLSVVDGYIAGALVEDNASNRAQENTTNLGEYIFSDTPFGVLSANDGVFVESNLSNLMSLKAPALSKVISPITTLLLDFPALADELTVALSVDEGELRSNFLKSDDLNIAKLDQMVYGIYVNDLSNEFSSSLNGSSPASLDGIFDIGKDVVNASSIVRKTDLLAFFDALENYSGTTEDLEDDVKDQKQKAQSDSPFEVSVIDGYISDARVSDIDGKLAEQNASKIGYYNFRVSPYGELNASGGIFSESNITNHMVLKAPPLSRVISPITTLLLDFSNLATILESALGVTNEQLVGNFLSADDLNIAKLAQITYGMYVTDNVDDFNASLSANPPASLDDIFSIAEDIANSKGDAGLVAFLESVANYSGSAVGLEDNIKEQKDALTSNNPFSLSVVDGYISGSLVEDNASNRAQENITNLGEYIFSDTPFGVLSARGGVFVESNLSNLMSLKAPALSKVISPITTLLLDFPNLADELTDGLGVSEEELRSNFLESDDLNIAKLAQMVYGIYVNELSNEFASLLDGSSPASLDDIFDIGKDVVNARSIVRKTDLLAFFDALENYNGTTSALEVAIKDQKQKAQSDSPFEVSVIDGYISDARVSDIDGKLAEHNESKIGYYNFRVSPYGELNASGGIFSESNITNHMVLKAPPLSRVISPITTLLLDFSNLATILESALGVTNEQLVGNFLSADDLNIAKLAQITYGMYVTDNVDDFNASLSANPPASLDDIFSIAEDIANSKGDADLVTFLGAVENYSDSAEGLERAIKEQKDAIASAVKFSLSVVDGYISGSLVEDNASNRAQENITNLGEYIFSDTPFGVLSANGGVFVESNLSNLMSLKAPALSKVISPITTLLLDFPALADELTDGLGVSEEELRGNFLESDDLNIAKLDQMVYGIYVNELSNEFASLLDGSSPASLDDIFDIGKDVVNASSIVRKTDLLAFFDALENYNGTTSALEVAIKDQKQKAQSDSPFEVSVIDGYISDARVSDIDGKLAEHNESKIGYYNFRVSPYGELNASGGIFSESNITNHMVLKAPPLSRVISPITTLLLDFSNLATILESALGVTNEQLVGNFLSADDLNIAKLAQITYGMYVTDNADDFNASLSANPPASLDDIFSIAEDIANSKGDAGLVAFLESVANYSGSAVGLEDNIKEQKDALTSNNPFSLSVVDGYISGSLVEDNASNRAQENITNLGEYIFSDTPFGVLSARGGVFVESNLSNLMSLKAPALSKVISPITTLLLDFPALADELTDGLGVSEEELRGNFLESDDLNIAKLDQMVYGIYVNELSNEFASLLDGSSPASLDDIFDIGKDVVNARSIVRKTDLLAFFDALENYNGTTSALEVAIKDQKQKAQSDSPFEVSVIDGYISDARVSDIDGKLAEHNESKIGYYNFRVSPYGELNASGGIFSESNITNHMVLKAPPLSRVISPITTLLLDFSNLATILESALGVTNEQLVGNFLSADDLNIAKLAQITYGMYVTDNADDFNASLSANPPASLDDIFSIAEDIANSKGDAGLVAFLESVANYSGSAVGLEDNIKEQKDALTSNNPFSLSVVDGYISGSLVEDNASNRAQENITNLGEYIFSDTPFGVLSARGGVFVESNLSNLMSLKAPALSKVISPITTLLLDFPALADELTVGLGVSEEELRSNFLESDDLNIAKLAQMVYGIYANELSNEFASLLDGSSPASLDDIFDIGKDVVNARSIVRKTDLLAFFDALENYNGTTSALEVAIKDQKQKAQSDSPFEVSVIDGYISDARVSDIDGKLAEHNESKIGYYNFRVSPYGELNASGGIFSESNITNHMVLKAPPLSRVISPITTLLLDFSNLATILESALGVTNEQLVGNFLSADDLNIAKLAQITYGMYVTDNADDFNASLSANPPASLDDIFSIAEDIANSKGDAGLVAFLESVANYSGSAVGLEDNIKEQKDALTSNNPFSLSVVDGYISGSLVEDNASNRAQENITNLGEYIFSDTPFGVLSARGGVFVESNLSNLMSLKAPALSKVISPITTLLLDFPNLADELTDGLGVSEEELRSNFLESDDLNIAKLAQMVYGIYVNDLSNEFASLLDGSSPASLDDIFDIGKDVVNARSIVRKTDLLAFFDALENYNGTTSALEVAIKDQKQKAQSDSPFEVSVIDGYISDARVSDIDGKLAEHNESKIGYYNFRVSPYGELNASGGIFSESNITNHMVLKAPPLSRVISPITTLLLDFSNLATILESALGVTNEQLVGNFLSADDLNIAKLAQITYGMYVTDNADDFNASLSANPPASLDDIFSIAEDIANSKGDAGLVAFLESVANYSGSAVGLEDNIKEQKDALTSNNPFSLSVVDGYISGSLVEDNASNRAQENITNLGEYIFSDTPFGVLSARGGVFVESNLSNLMSLKAPALSKVISPITTLLLDFPNLADELTDGLGVSEEELRSNFLESDDLNIAKLAQVIYGSYIVDVIDDVNSSLSTNPPSSLDELIESIALVVDEASITYQTRIDTALFLDKVKTYDGNTDELEAFISPYKGALQGEGPSLVNYWAKAYGGGGDDQANSITQTSDGGYVVAGWTNSFRLGQGKDNFWVLKLDSSGNIVWQRAYGGGGDDQANSITQTSDGGYVVAGWTNSFKLGQGKDNFWVLKLDTNGDIVWQRAYGGGGDNEANSIAQTSDGGYVVAGWTNSFSQGSSHFWLLKLDTNGDIVWQRAYGGSGDYQANSMTQTSDGGYVVAGWTNSFSRGSSDFWVLKLDSDGDITWQKSYGGDGLDVACSIIATSDGGYLVAGETDSFGAGSDDFWVLKLDSNGSIGWQKTYGGSSTDRANSIIQTSADSGYAVAGFTDSFGVGSDDIWILKLSSDGNITWQKAYGGSGSDYATSIVQTSDGGYVVAGWTNSFSLGQGKDNFWVLKLDTNGNILFRPTSGASIVNTNTVASDTIATTTDTIATTTDTTAIPTDTTAIPTDTTANITSQAP